MLLWIRLWIRPVIRAPGSEIRAANNNNKQRLKNMKYAMEEASAYDMDSDEELELERAALAMGREDEGEVKEAKEFTYNVDAIHERLEDISRVCHLPWEDTLVCTSSDAEVMELSVVHDDTERELKFYDQAFEAVRESIEKFDESGHKWRRPDDYLAEMVSLPSSRKTRIAMSRLPSGLT